MELAMIRAIYLTRMPMTLSKESITYITWMIAPFKQSFSCLSCRYHTNNTLNFLCIGEILAFVLRFSAMPYRPTENRPAVTNWCSILRGKDR